MALVQQALRALAGLPEWLIYGILAAGAAFENIFPPVPADVFVLVGGVLAAHGFTDARAVFLLTWIPNASSAMGVYFLARRYGARFFKMPVARWLLREHQLEEMARFYQRWGIPTIFVGRLMPGWRAAVPVFAGLARMPPARVFAPVLVASAIWHGLLVWLGLLAGRNLSAVLAVFDHLSRTLLWIGLALLVLFAAWWWRTRHRQER
jgi:membrane protein DedA with SNARE-associated domain